MGIARRSSLVCHFPQIKSFREQERAARSNDQQTNAYPESHPRVHAEEECRQWRGRDADDSKHGVQLVKDHGAFRGGRHVAEERVAHCTGHGSAATNKVSQVAPEDRPDV